MHCFRTVAMQRALAPAKNKSLACRNFPASSSRVALLYTVEQKRTPDLNLSLSGSATPGLG